MCLPRVMKKGECKRTSPLCQESEACPFGELRAGSESIEGKGDWEMSKEFFSTLLAKRTHHLNPPGDVAFKELLLPDRH